MRRGPVPLVALLAAAMLVLAACGGSGSSEAGSDPASPGADTAAGTIVIGYGASESGHQASNGLNGAAAARAWEKATNAAGGIDGHPVKIEITDTKNTIPGAESAIKQFESDRGVSAILFTDLAAEIGMSGFLKTVPMAVISGGGTIDATWGSAPNLFQDVSGQTVVIQSYVDGAKAAGGRTFGLAACAEAAVCAAAAEPAQKYATALGMKYGGTQVMASTDTSFTAPCLAFQSKGVDAIGVSIGVDTAVRFMSDCLQQGYKGVFAMPNAAFDQVKVGKLTGARTIDSTQGFPWWVNDPKVKAYRDAMAKYQPGASYQNSYGTSIWASLELFKKALENAKPATIDRTSVSDAMSTIKNETLGGLLAQPITYTKGEKHPAVTCYWEFEFTGGDREPTLVAPKGASGNGAAGALASTCADARGQ